MWPRRHLKSENYLFLICSDSSALFRGMDYAEQASAVWFFADFAEDHPEYRHHVLGPNGLSLTISRLREYIPVSEQSPISATDLRMIQLLCTPLHSATDFIWAVPTLLALDSCNVLCQLLVYVTLICCL
jgi:hypothetical protein